MNEIQSDLSTMAASGTEGSGCCGGGGGGITGGEECYITIFLMEFNMFIVSKFILTVSHNDNPIIDFVYRLKNMQKNLNNILN